MTSATIDKQEQRSFLDRLLNRNKPQTRSRDRVVYQGAQHDGEVKKGSFNISHAPEMVDELKNDHAELIRLFVAITNHMHRDDFDNAMVDLKEFLKLLRDHVVEENLRLYGYLRALDDDAKANVDIDFAKCQSEMRKIHLAVRDFVEAYIKTEIHKGNKHAFLLKWVGEDGDSAKARISRQNSIKETLIERVEFEEKRLYPSYLSLGSTSRK